MNKSLDRGITFLDSQNTETMSDASAISPPLALVSTGTLAEVANKNPTFSVQEYTDHATKMPNGYSVSPDGLYYTPPDKDDEPATPIRVCSPLRVLAMSRDNLSENWGRVVEFSDPDSVHHRWVIPMEMLAADGLAVRRELSRRGLEISPGAQAKYLLLDYLNESNPTARVRRVEQTGWFGNSFVMPDRTIGVCTETVLFQSAVDSICPYSQRGTLDQWRDHVSRRCSGNSRLIFSLSASFAGMILQHIGQESSGFHFVGGSSTGKTTAQLIAASIYGGPSFKQSWRATGNALEGACAMHNDTSLILDEMGEVDPSEIGSIVYMIANGVGKGRAGRTGESKRRASWRVMILSSGELGLAQHMLDGGKIAKAGQEIRMIDISADAGAGHGIFENLHEHESAADLADELKEAAKNYFGTPSVAFLEHLIGDLESFPSMLKNEMVEFIAANLPSGSAGQATRVCRKFAAIASAGEFATKKGITGWQEGDAIVAAAICFRSWLADKGGNGANQEGPSILSRIKAFFESHGEYRFTDIADASARPTINRAGFKKATPEGFEYYVLPEVFKREICSGLDPRVATKVLVDAEWLEPDNAGKKSAQRKTLPQVGLTRVYVFTQKMWKE